MLTILLVRVSIGAYMRELYIYVLHVWNTNPHYTVGSRATVARLLIPTPHNLFCAYVVRRCVKNKNSTTMDLQCYTYFVFFIVLAGYVSSSKVFHLCMHVLCLSVYSWHSAPHSFVHTQTPIRCVCVCVCFLPLQNPFVDPNPHSEGREKSSVPVLYGFIKVLHSISYFISDIFLH